jgi:hypothetical protein
MCLISRSYEKYSLQNGTTSLLALVWFDQEPMGMFAKHVVVFTSGQRSYHTVVWVCGRRTSAEAVHIDFCSQFRYEMFIAFRCIRWLLSQAFWASLCFTLRLYVPRVMHQRCLNIYKECSDEQVRKRGRAIAQAVSRRPLTAEARVRSVFLSVPRWTDAWEESSGIEVRGKTSEERSVV